MSIEDMYKSFENIKRIVYPSEFKRLGFTDLVSLIVSENKSPEIKSILKNIYKYISVIKKSIRNLGQKILELHDSNAEYENIQLYDKNNLEGHTKDIIFFLDQFIDPVSALNRVYEFEESKYELEMIEAFMRSNRDILLKKANSFRKEKSLRQDLDKKEIIENYRQFLTDTIDIIVREAMKLSVLKIHAKIREIIDSGELND